MVSSELIPRGELEKSKNGKYDISYSQLIRLPLERYHEIDDAMTVLIHAYPDYEFSVSDDVLTGGRTIYWRYLGNDRAGE